MIRARVLSTTWRGGEGVVLEALFAVGGLGVEGFVVRSDNDGKTWAPTIWRGSIGGGVWKGMLPKEKQHGLRSIWGNGLEEVFVVGEYGTVLRSVDGGESFTREPIESAGCMFGFVGRGAWLYASGDDGLFARKRKQKRWRLIDKTPSLGRMWRVGDDVIVLGKGALLRVDATESVTRLRVPAEISFTGLCSLDVENWIVVGAEGAAFATKDGGRTFMAMATGVKKRFAGVAALGDLVVAVGASGQVVSSAGGGRFTVEKPPKAGLDLWGVWSNGNSMYIAGDKGHVWRVLA